jgi:type VI secretion system protein ImpE
MTETVTPADLFRQGALTKAVEAANAAVRGASTDPAARVLLAELLVFAGNLERADVILDACGDIDPGLAVVVAEFRQLVRGEMARRQLFRDGRVPEFLGEPTEAQRAALAGLVALRGGDAEGAGAQAEAAEAARGVVRGRAGDAAFDDLRDADDLLAPTMEAITTTGKYYWLPMSRVLSVEFHPPKRPRDLYWRRASVSVAGGPDGDVYVPAIYPVEGIEPGLVTDALRLGRATDWVTLGDGPTRGIGAVTWLVGEEARTVLELGSLVFDVAPGPQVEPGSEVEAG